MCPPENKLLKSVTKTGSAPTNGALPVLVHFKLVRCRGRPDALHATTRRRYGCLALKLFEKIVIGSCSGPHHPAPSPQRCTGRGGDIERKSPSPGGKGYRVRAKKGSRTASKTWPFSGLSVPGGGSGGFG